MSTPDIVATMRPGTASIAAVRLHSIRMNQFRGVRSLSLELKGRNAAIIGPNGTGKSSVADAVDFLLTGQIRRLTGEGAQSVSLAKHGRHIDVKPEDSWVEAVVDVAGKQHVIRRCVASPDDLQSDGPLPEAVERALDSAKGGHHLLTRREILRYVFTEPSSRGQQVAALLQLTSLDSLRKELQGAAKLAKDMLDRRLAVQTSNERGLLRCFDPPVSDRKGVLTEVNVARARLGAPALPELIAGGLRFGVIAPTAVVAHPLSTARAENSLTEVLRWIGEKGTAFVGRAVSYLEAVESLHSDAETLKALRAADLVDRGLALVPEEHFAIVDDVVATPLGECPLCLSEWDLSALRARLRERASVASTARERVKALERQRQDLQRALVAASTAARFLGSALASPAGTPVARYPAAADAGRAVLQLEAALSTLGTALLPDPLAVGNLPTTETRLAAIAACISTDLAVALEAARNEAASQPAVSVAQLAWDTLTGVEQALSECQAAAGERAAAARVAVDLIAIDRHFVAARDEVLDGTYSAIAGRLKELYRILHGPDEASFSATLAPTKAGLKLEVDFYGRGEHPPCALHSEGHQDSLGLCFFLTLTEYLARGPLPFVVLDDVLMSVDTGHRRAVAELLKREFPNCQFIITTHDRVWWRQLRSLGVVTSRGSLEFKSWTLEDGPLVHADAAALFRDVDVALESGSVPGAAHALRRGIETILPDICDALGAVVRFRGDGAWAAGDFLPAAMSRYNDLFKQARATAHSWSDSSTDWAALESVKKAAFQKYSAETWAVNVNVHFNEWADFSKEDFRPVVEAYRALFACFVCDNCGVPLRVMEEGASATALRCDCNRTNWNLKPREK